MVDGEQKIFNLAVKSGDISGLRIEDIHSFIKLLVLMIATSYRIAEEDRVFKSEYIISQGIMLACKKLRYDGVAYFSKRIDDEIFALTAINLVLFADYKKNEEYAEICRHLKVDESLNYQFFKQLTPAAKYKTYDLRAARNEYITNIGNRNYNYDYRETEFYEFDAYLFGRWENKNIVQWGNAIENE